MIVVRAIPVKEGTTPCHTAGLKTRSLPASTCPSRSGGAGPVGASSPCAIIATVVCAPSMAPCRLSVSAPIVPNGCVQPTPGPSVRQPKRPWPCPGGRWAGTWCVGWATGVSPATGRWDSCARHWLTQTRVACLTMPSSAPSAATNRGWPPASTIRTCWRRRMRTWTP